MGRVSVERSKIFQVTPFSITVKSKNLGTGVTNTNTNNVGIEDLRMDLERSDDVCVRW